MRNLKLNRPIVFFDLETTGTDVKKDRIVEISVVKLFPSGEKEIKTRRLNPEMPIPPEATAIHGISDSDVSDAPTFRSVSKSLYEYLEGCDLGGYNIIRFDIPLLATEFSRCGITFSLKDRKIVDPYIVFCKKEPRTLSAAYKFYCNKDLEDAHTAEADILATIEILEGQLNYYEDIPDNPDELSNFCNPSEPSWIDSGGKFKWQNDEAVINFGKNAGISLKEIALTNPGFLQWILRNDFDDEVKEIARKALIGKFPERI